MGSWPVPGAGCAGCLGDHTVLNGFVVGSVADQDAAVPRCPVQCRRVHGRRVCASAVFQGGQRRHIRSTQAHTGAHKYKTVLRTLHTLSRRPRRTAVSWPHGTVRATGTRRQSSSARTRPSVQRVQYTTVGQLRRCAAPSSSPLGDTQANGTIKFSRFACPTLLFAVPALRLGPRAPLLLQSGAEGLYLCSLRPASLASWITLTQHPGNPVVTTRSLARLFFQRPFLCGPAIPTRIPRPSHQAYPDPIWWKRALVPGCLCLCVPKGQATRFEWECQVGGTVGGHNVISIS